MRYFKVISLSTGEECVVTTVSFEDTPEDVAARWNIDLAQCSIEEVSKEEIRLDEFFHERKDGCSCCCQPDRKLETREEDLGEE